MLTRLLPTLALGGALLLGGCTGDDGDGASADERLDSAATALEQAEAFDISLTTPELPSGTKGLLSATGIGDHSPAFQGDVKVVVGGATIGAEVIAVDDKVWAKTGFSPIWAPLDPSSLGAPDPADLVGKDSDSGLGSLLGATEDVEAGDQSRDGKEVLTEITGTLPGGRIQDLIPTADEKADFAVTYRLTDDDELHDATIKGPFYGDEDVTYTLTLDPRDEPADITAP